jgi:WD40 repeat protein
VAFSPDGATLASAHWDGKVLLWSLKGLRPVTKAHLEPKPDVMSVAFAPAGNVLVTGSRTLQMWDLGGVQPQARTELKMEGFPNLIAAVCFATDGKTLAACNLNGTATVWDVAGNRVTRRATITKTSSLTAAALTPDGKSLALGCLDQMIYLWDLGRARPVERAALRAGCPVSSVSYSPRGSLLATATEDGQVVLWQGRTKLQSWQMRARFSQCNSLPMAGTLLWRTVSGPSTSCAWRVESPRER